MRRPSATVWRRGRSERGSQLLEMAFVFPLLMILVAGIVDYGLLFQSYEIVENAAREGVRIKVEKPTITDADLQTRVANYIATAGLTGTPTTTVTGVTMTPAGGGANFSGFRVDVQYTHQFAFIGPMVTLIGATFANSLTFTASATMRTIGA